MSSKPERAYPTPYTKDAAFNQSSISLHPTQILSFVSLICGENTYCSFSVVLNQDLSNKNEKFQRLRSKKSEEVIPHTVLTVYIYIYMRCIHIYCYLEQSCREESLSMLVQHGKPPSLSGFSS